MVNGDGDWGTREIPMGFELVSCLDQSHEIVGSCNGFLCIAPEKGDAPVYLLNPITRETMRLPKSQLILNRRYSVGFGFDRLSKKYKVVRVYYEGNLRSHGVRAFSEIITVGQSSWRKLEFPAPFQQTYGRFNSRSNPVLLDGTGFERELNLP
ncbi:hypothetical protein NE237_011402 [Protea cynaroides]|uniref:F-box associated beta-propeller type 3 domain-containing protein n=1 Tax=Protea cynaroides TaxID=273540 RepID=A0A9Q0JVT9_9MAGN|nr:hypothetical protein NE237_011402 [Protea cynaroides]